MSIEKTVQTLGDLLVADAQRLVQRHRSTIAWLDLLQPVITRNSGLVQASDRFERRDAVPGRPQPVVLEPEAADPFEEIPEGEPVGSELRERLRPVVGPGLEQARLHTGAASDAFARAQRADAVTVGRDVHFRAGAFDPHSPAGLGLLAHELTHVAEGQRPGADWRRATSEGVRAEERLAHAREHSLAAPAISPIAAQAYAPAAPPQAAVSPHSPLVGPSFNPRPPASPPAAGPQNRPMRADEDRPAAPTPPPPAPQPEANLDRLRQTLFRDIMARIRVEFERGA